MSDSKNLFSIRGLEFAYGKNRVIRGLNLDIVEGKITTLIGANGCGKTTLFNLMTKNLKPNAGAIELHGAPLDAISANAMRSRSRSCISTTPRLMISRLRSSSSTDVRPTKNSRLHRARTKTKRR